MCVRLFCRLKCAGKWSGTLEMKDRCDIVLQGTQNTQGNLPKPIDHTDLEVNI